VDGEIFLNLEEMIFSKNLQIYYKMGRDTFYINYYKGNGYLVKIKGQIEDIIEALSSNGFDLSENVFVIGLDDGEKSGENPVIFFGTLISKIGVELEGPYEILNHHHSLNYKKSNKKVNNPIQEMNGIEKIFKNVKVKNGTFIILTTLCREILNYENDS